MTIDADGEGNRIPDFKPREQVQIRIIGYSGTDERGRDKYRCSMMPVDSIAGGDAAAGGSKGSGKGAGKGTSKGGKGNEGFSVFFTGRSLENETTLATQE